MLRPRFSWFVSEPLRKFQTSILFLFILIVGGTIGYTLIEGMDPVDSLYMTIITITTVGFGEVHALSTAGRIFTIILIVLGVGAGAWAIRNGVEIVLGTTLWDSVQRKKMLKAMNSLEGHYIICGYGRIGHQIIKDLVLRGRSFIVIDQNPNQINELQEEGYLYVQGNATHDDTLENAGIVRAKGLIATLDTDADNVLAVLTARGLNPNLQIIARAGNENAESKLLRAGADRVVSPYAIGGHRLALGILQPTVYDFLNKVFNIEHTDVDLREIPISKNSSLVGKPIAESKLKVEWEFIIIAIKRTDGSFDISPDALRMFQEGETMIILGKPEKIEQFLAVETS